MGKGPRLGPDGVTLALERKPRSVSTLTNGSFSLYVGSFCYRASLSPFSKVETFTSSQTPVSGTSFPSFKEWKPCRHPPSFLSGFFLAPITPPSCPLVIISRHPSRVIFSSFSLSCHSYVESARPTERFFPSLPDLRFRQTTFPPPFFQLLSFFCLDPYPLPWRG